MNVFECVFTHTKDDLSGKKLPILFRFRENKISTIFHFQIELDKFRRAGYRQGESPGKVNK